MGRYSQGKLKEGGGGAKQNVKAKLEGLVVVALLLCMSSLLLVGQKGTAQG